jgi:lipopolysaccharide transport system ATP-binding protein
MKNSPVITVKNISKSYNISHEMKASAGNVTFRDAIINTLKKPKELLTGHIMKKEKFWALKGIDFEINKGEVVGIIGHNGSGKSTLLKILSRIVEPTKGEGIMHGRVASLLEVGTGFHPELSGRENVYFNGSILGMKKKEIDAKFDEIVAFSGVEKFLDTPVKFYSSGMYVRLAFAVAAHLDPDILIVDEVLAVGDADFQKKCLGKMQDVAGQGRTVIFVSHSMDSVRKLCSRAILLEKGRVLYDGDVNRGIDKYLNPGVKKSEGLYSFKKDINKDAQLNKIEILNQNLKHTSLIGYEDNWKIEIEYVSRVDLEGAIVLIEFASSDGTTIYTTSNIDSIKPPIKIVKGVYRNSIAIDRNMFVPGIYLIKASIQIPGKKILDISPEMSINIFDQDSDTRSSLYQGRYFGFFGIKTKWEKKGN